MLVLLPFLPAPFIVRISVKPVFVPVLVSITVLVLISLFLLVITTVVLRCSRDQPIAAKR
jgi:hypothetical protein